MDIGTKVFVTTYGDGGQTTSKATIIAAMEDHFSDFIYDVELKGGGIIHGVHSMDLKPMHLAAKVLIKDLAKSLHYATIVEPVSVTCSGSMWATILLNEDQRRYLTNNHIPWSFDE